MYWEPAESGSLQAVGCGGRLPARLRQHADEVIAGTDRGVTGWQPVCLPPATRGLPRLRYHAAARSSPLRFMIRNCDVSSVTGGDEI